MAEPRFRLPAGAWVGTVEGQGGWPLRAMLAEPAVAPRGTLLFLSGRADFLEKWAEAYPEFLARGWRVAAFDWRGQGGSGRATANGAGHVADFGVLAADLACAVVHFRPDAVVAHSMGAHVLARWLAVGNRVPRAAMLSPLFGLAQPAWLRGTAALLARAAALSGRAEGFAFGQRPYGGVQKSALRARLLTADAERFADEHAWLATDPSLAVGGVSWGWLDALRRSRRELGPTALARIDTPVLVLLAEHEALVSNADARAAAAAMPDARVETIADAAHELLREREPVRAAVLSRLHAFLETT